MTERRGHGWWPYILPYISFLLLVEISNRVPDGLALVMLVLKPGVPVGLMVWYRGYTRHGAIQDTAATYTERFLNAFGIDYYLVEGDQDADRITIAFNEAERTKRPVAVLVGDEYHGFNR